MKKKIICGLLIIAIVIIGITIYNRIENNKLKEKISLFNETIMDAAEDYIEDNLDNYEDFKEPGDYITISVEELIENDVIEKDIENPTGEDFSDILVRLTIESETIINYEVVYTKQD